MLERSLLEQVELDRHVPVIEQRPAEAEDRRVGEEQQFVEKPRPEKLRGERRAAHTEGAVGRERHGLIVVSADPQGVFKVANEGHVRLPTMVRQWCGLAAGDRVFIVTDRPADGW
ncbi:hypothetical protein AB0B83_27060 [Micromonospora sp. NPDC049060]|uniref:hypothetical protein n=1 Tax=Micromonospora sp. NPDC049060 TaxID=3154828 RepID=UPI003406EFEC